jgi:signal transduction histidine kinase
MLRDFILSHRSELVQRCRSRVAQRRAPRPTPFELEHGIPIFIDELVRMMPSGASADGTRPDGVKRSAGLHGEELLRHGFTIDQVVHDYGDLCQSITQLAGERAEAISAPDFATLNMTLDNAIASAVVEWTRGREENLGVAHAADTNQALGVLAHELRNNLNTAILAIAAIKGGGVGMTGATAAALDRSLIGMRDLIDGALTEVRLNSDPTPLRVAGPIELSSFIAEVQVAAAMEATSMGRDLTVLPVEPGVFVQADRSILAAALANLLQNAFKFSRKGGHVILRTTAVGGKVLIAVEDECGGLPDDVRERIFQPFEQVRRDPRGLGLGLAISRRGVEANGGKLGVRNVPGTGCVFTIELPRVERPPRS